jgi:membrane protein DedA with SNARE-associated domain/rhodanese-related sulfurtransferase
VTGPLIAAIGAHGVLLVFLNVLINQAGLPVPAVPTLIVAGAIAAGGGLPWAPLVLWCVVACCISDCAWYFIGQTYGIQVLKLLCRISLEPDSCVSQTQTRFERWGVNSLLFAKFIPGLSAIAPPLAGAMRLGWPRFMALSTASAALWAGSLLAAGALFKAQITVLLAHVGAVGSVAGGTAAAVLAAYIGYKWWERSRFYRSLRMARIDVGELYELMQAGAKPVIVDVRSATARALEPRRIPGAVNISLEAAAAHLKDLPRDRDIILYCSCPSEASAARVARILMRHGFTKVRPLLGGLEAWAAAGYAVVGVSEPEPTEGSIKK